MADDTNIVNFRPRPDGSVPPLPMPPLPPAPRPSTPTVETGDREVVDSAASMASLPGVDTMGPPVALMMPPLPAAGDGSSDDGEEGEFAPPSPENPENPTIRDALQVAIAVLAAMGVAGAQGMWHRARHRQALADQARANADKAHAKAAGTGHHTGGSGSGGGGRSGSRHESGHRRRSHGPSAGGHGGSGPSGHGPGRRKKRSEGGHDDSHGGGHKRRKDGLKAPKSTPDGRTVPDATRKHRKRRKVKGGLGDGPCLQTRKPRKSDAKNKSKDAKGTTPSTPKPRRTMRWKAPRKSRPGPGGDKALPAGRKRWTRIAPDDPAKPGSKQGKGPKAKQGRKRRMSWFRWKSTPAWLKRWRTRRTVASTSTSSAGSTQPGGRAAGTGSTPPPPPPRGASWMRPPPGADRSTTFTAERVHTQHRPRQHEEAAAVAGAPAAGWPALPPAAASSETSRRTSPPPAPPNGATTNGGQMSSLVPAPRTGTQYADADLTIYDVIEADADMSEEILAGVDDARAAADGCEVLMTRLEAIHAEIVELKVPGVLAGLFLKLMEKTLTVKAKAEAIAANLPAAAEAISTAGANAADRHRPLADAVRDAGHIRPAEREYHDE